MHWYPKLKNGIHILRNGCKCFQCKWYWWICVPDWINCERQWRKWSRKYFCRHSLAVNIWSPWFFSTATTVLARSSLKLCEHSYFHEIYCNNATVNHSVIESSNIRELYLMNVRTLKIQVRLGPNVDKYIDMCACYVSQLQIHQSTYHQFRFCMWWLGSSN